MSVGDNDICFQQLRRENSKKITEADISTFAAPFGSRFKLFCLTSRRYLWPDRAFRKFPPKISCKIQAGERFGFIGAGAILTTRHASL